MRMLCRLSHGRYLFQKIRYVQTSSIFEGLMIPANRKNKVVTASDAVELICSNDTVCVSGFVSQGSPDAILQELRFRYEKEGQPQDLTLLFGGGPGDWCDRGLNHLARVPSDSECATLPLVKRAIGAHYGQTPELAALAISNKIEAWTLPLGSISRMIRAQATHSPGHITTVGLGTYVDPDTGTGGAVNDLAKSSPIQKSLVTKFGSLDQEYLMYKALPIEVAIIRATTADASGNLSFEDESLLCDQKITAMAARNSGGVVIAQVKQLCAVGSLPARSVHIPGAMVDCVVVVKEEDHDYLHPMSFESRHDPVLTSQIKTPADEIQKMPLTERKIISRRASFSLKPDKCINLGIGLPEGVAAVASEEGMLRFVTLTTEPGVFGGLPAPGRQFGPASNADALIEMNQMFDFYDGGGLDQCFLGAAQINEKGDVNVSRLSMDRLTGKFI
jgi:propionate CoA-transferase